MGETMGVHLGVFQIEQVFTGDKKQRFQSPNLLILNVSSGMDGDQGVVRLSGRDLRGELDCLALTMALRQVSAGLVHS